MSVRSEIGCAAVGLAVVGLGVFVVLQISRIASKLLAMEGAMHSYRYSCEYLVDLVDLGEPWPDSERAFDEGFRAYANVNGISVVFADRYTEFVRFNPEWEPGAAVCSEFFPLQPVQPDLLPCETREGWCGGQWLAETMAENVEFFEAQDFPAPAP